MFLFSDFFKWILDCDFIKRWMFNINADHGRPLEILYMSEHFIVINKDPDILINSDDHLVNHQTVHTKLAKMFPHLVQMKLKHGFHWIHRLDYSTSGILCIGLNKKAARAGSYCFMNGLVDKYYLALVYGHLEHDSIEIDVPISQDIRPGFEHKMCVTEADEAKMSKSMIFLLQRGLYNDQKASKILIKPVTGRRHQIRVHCNYIGHSIIGDYTYNVEPQIDPHRMFLHAFKLYMPTSLEIIDLTTQDLFTESNSSFRWRCVQTINEIKPEFLISLKSLEISQKIGINY